MKRIASKAARLCMLLSLIFGIGSAQAQVWLTISGKSWHTDRDTQYCETNPGLGLEYRADDSDLAYVGGHYKNSYCRSTTYLGAAWQPLQLGPVRAGVLAAAASGYDSPLLVMPAITVTYERVALNVIASPALGKYTGFIGLQLGLRLF